MKNSINLAAQKQDEKGTIARKIFITSISLFVIVFIFTLGLLFYNFILTRQYDALSAQEADALAKIQAQGEKKVNYLYLKERINSIESLITARSNINVHFDDLLETIPDGIDINSTEVIPDRIVMTMSTPTLSLFDTMLDALYNLKAESTSIESVKLVSFGVDSTTLMYSTQLEVGFPKKE